MNLHVLILFAASAFLLSGYASKAKKQTSATTAAAAANAKDTGNTTGR